MTTYTIFYISGGNEMAITIYAESDQDALKKAQYWFSINGNGDESEIEVFK